MTIEPFPDPECANADGLLAYGGDLSPQRLILAYRSGIFPWYSEGQPILWWSPDPRCVFLPEWFRVPHTVRKELKRMSFTASIDCAFADVIRGCARAPRPGQGGTWLVPDMIRAYERLHDMGLAHSVEVWDDDELVGGLYGVRLGHAFFGESMFHTKPHASKRALVTLMESLMATGCQIVDCQMPTSHLMRFGARNIPRREFLVRLHAALYEA